MDRRGYILPFILIGVLILGSLFVIGRQYYLLQNSKPNISAEGGVLQYEIKKSILDELPKLPNANWQEKDDKEFIYYFGPKNNIDGRFLALGKNYYIIQSFNNPKDYKNYISREYRDNLEMNGWIPASAKYKGFDIMDGSADAPYASTQGYLKMNGDRMSKVTLTSVVDYQHSSDPNRLGDLICPCTSTQSIFISNEIDLKNYINTSTLVK